MTASNPESTMTILVVDAQQSMQRVLQAGLEAAGHRVLAVAGDITNEDDRGRLVGADADRGGPEALRAGRLP